MTGRGDDGDDRTRKGRARLKRTGGRYGKGYMYMHHNLALSLASSFQPSLRISTDPTPKSNLKSNTERRGTEESSERKEGATKESKHLGNGVLYIHPQEKGVGRLFLVCSWSQATKRDGGREEGTNRKNPPFLVFYCHLIQLIAHCLFLWSSSCFLHFFSSSYILYSLSVSCPRAVSVIAHKS